MPNNDTHILAAFAGVILLFYTEGLPPFLFLLFFMFGAVIASFKKIGKIYGISPDLDNFGIIKKLVGHRSIVFHSPIVPIIILKFSGIDFACAYMWECNLTSALIYGFCFGWLVHVIADGIQNMGWWDIPLKNTKKGTRLTLGIICFISALITLGAVYFINSGYLQIPGLHELLIYFRNFILLN